MRGLAFDIGEWDMGFIGACETEAITRQDSPDRGGCSPWARPFGLLLVGAQVPNGADKERGSY